MSPEPDDLDRQTRLKEAKERARQARKKERAKLEKERARIAALPEDERREAERELIRRLNEEPLGAFGSGWEKRKPPKNKASGPKTRRSKGKLGSRGAVQQAGKRRNRPDRSFKTGGR